MLGVGVLVREWVRESRDELELMEYLISDITREL